MELVKTKGVKERIQEYAKLIRNEKVRTNDEFFNDLDRLFDAVLFYVVKYQDDTGRKTLQPSEWSARQVNKADEIKREINKLRSKQAQ
jgi:hypothetical protein